MKIVRPRFVFLSLWLLLHPSIPIDTTMREAVSVGIRSYLVTISSARQKKMKEKDRRFTLNQSRNHLVPFVLNFLHLIYLLVQDSQFQDYGLQSSVSRQVVHGPLLCCECLLPHCHRQNVVNPYSLEDMICKGQGEWTRVVHANAIVHMDL